MTIKPAHNVDSSCNLVGRYVRLEPIDMERHIDDLFVAGRDAGIWTYMPLGPFEDKVEMGKYFRRTQSQEDWQAYAIVDIATDKSLGMTCYVQMRPSMATIEIGAVWFGPEMKRSRLATEAIYLQMRHAFEDLDYRRVEWKCDNRNKASKRAAKRFGFVYEGLFRQHMIVKGQSRDTAWFAVIDGDWPDLKARFDAWLEPDNFDGAGLQINPLQA